MAYDKTSAVLNKMKKIAPKVQPAIASNFVLPNHNAGRTPVRDGDLANKAYVDAAAPTTDSITLLNGETITNTVDGEITFTGVGGSARSITFDLQGDDASFPLIKDSTGTIKFGSGIRLNNGKSLRFSNSGFDFTGTIAADNDGTYINGGRDIELNAGNTYEIDLNINDVNVVNVDADGVEVTGSISATTGVTVGNAPATPAAGTIEWNGTNFRGYNGTSWVNLDN